MALAFQLAQPGCSTITVGLKTRQQVEEMVNAVNEKQSYNWPEIISELEKA
jgi:aryl-alcohol dehydrogenase-like predicted oxidoreductase